jgi:hypothetical protein
LTRLPAAAPKREAPDTSPLQLELESFGITPKRAAALVESFSEDHIAKRIQHVRARTKDAKAAPLRNPAGYLAKAIEDSFAVKEQAPAVVAPSKAPPPLQTAVETPPALVAMPEPDGVWADLARELRARLSAATYAAFVAPVLQAAPEIPGGTRTLTLTLPSPFTFEKWHRPPIKGALVEATAALDLQLTLESPPETAPA